MEIKQQLKQSLQLVMTPQLQQAIRLLQLNQIELREEIGHELENNPVLADDLTDPRPKDKGDVAGGTDLSPEERVGLTERSEPDTNIADRLQEKKSAEVDWEQFLENRSQQQPMPSARGGYEDMPPIEQNLTKLESMQEHLLWQIQNSDFTDTERIFAELIIGNLDERGFLDVRAGYRDVIDETTRAIAADPRARGSIFNLAVMLEKLGHWDEAKVQLRRFLGMDASDEEKKFAQELVAVLTPLVREEGTLATELLNAHFSNNQQTGGGYHDSRGGDDAPRGRDPNVSALQHGKASAPQIGEALRTIRGAYEGKEPTIAVRAIEGLLDRLHNIQMPLTASTPVLEALMQRCFHEARTGNLSEALGLAKRIDASDLEPPERMRGKSNLENVEESKSEGRSELGDLDDPDTFIEHLADMAHLDHEDAFEVLKVMQHLDPVGCCSRDLRECLRVQAELYGCADTELAIIDRHLHNVEKRNWNAIARDLKVDVEEVIVAAKQIQKLDSRPARNFTTTDEKSIAITPDVYVSRDGDRWVVTDNDKGLQKLYINDQLAQRLLQDKQAEKFVTEKLRNAQWLIRAIEQRRRTIIRVTEKIVEMQKDFFEKGVAYLRPMILRDIAEAVDMHESTISRVTTNKYVHTPQGLFELKYFFNSAIRRTSEDDIASEAVKQAIKKLIDGEDKEGPLSDQQIVELLERQEGIQIARRTVAKYREVLGILASSKRKKMF